MYFIIYFINLFACLFLSLIIIFLLIHFIIYLSIHIFIYLFPYFFHFLIYFIIYLCIYFIVYLFACLFLWWLSFYSFRPFHLFHNLSILFHNLVSYSFIFLLFIYLFIYSLKHNIKVMSDISIDKQENNIIQIWLYKLLKVCTQTLYTHMVYFGGVSGVCHDWQFDFLTVLSPCIGMCMHRVFCQLDEALHCTTACSWFTPLFCNNFWSKIEWHVWLIRRGLIKVLKVYLRLFLPQSTSPWVYIFIMLGSQTWDQSDHLALAPALVYPFFVWKSSVLNSNSNGNIFGLLYSSYLYFEWVKIASLSMFLCVYFPFVCG